MASLPVAQSDRPTDLSLPEALRAISARKKYPIFGAAAGLVLGLTLALVLRPLYGAQVVVAFESQSGSQLSQLARSFGGIASIAGIDLLSGDGDDRAAGIATLDSHQALATFVEREAIGHAIFRETTRAPWSWLTERDNHSTWEAVRRLRKYLSVEELKPSGLLSVTVLWYDAQTAANWANDFTHHADSMLRKRALDRSKERLAFLAREYDRTPAVAVRDAMSKVMENELRTVMLASADKEFAFRVIEPAIVAERPVRPRRALLTVLLTSLGAFAGIVAALAAAVRERS